RAGPRHGRRPSSLTIRLSVSRTAGADRIGLPIGACGGAAFQRRGGSRIQAPPESWRSGRFCYNDLREDANHRRPPIGSPLGSLNPERRSRAKPPMGSGAQRGMRTTRWVLALVLTAVALGTAAWLITSVNELHDRLARHSQPLALVFVGAAGLLAVASAVA